MFQIKADDRGSSIVLLIISLLSCIGAARLHIGSFGRPGSGFFPLVLGVIVGVLSLSVLIEATFEKKPAKENQILLFGAVGQKKVLYVLLALICYGLLLETLGYALSIFLLLVFLLRVIDPQKWYFAIVGAFLASAGSYVLFQLCLKVQLPGGFLGI